MSCLIMRYEYQEGDMEKINRFFEKTVKVKEEPLIGENIIYFPVYIKTICLSAFCGA